MIGNAPKPFFFFSICSSLVKSFGSFKIHSFVNNRGFILLSLEGGHAGPRPRGRREDVVVLGQVQIDVGQGGVLVLLGGDHEHGRLAVPVDRRIGRHVVVNLEHKEISEER